MGERSSLQPCNGLVDELAVPPRELPCGAHMGVVADAAEILECAQLRGHPHAADLAAGPVCRLGLPVRVPLGFHATWVSGERMRAAAQPVE